MSFRIQPTISARNNPFSAGTSQLRARASGVYGTGNGIGSRSMSTRVEASTLQATGAPTGVMAAGLQPHANYNEIGKGLPAIATPANVGAGTVQRAGAAFGLNGAGRIGRAGAAFRVSGTPTPGGSGAPWTNPTPPNSAGPWTSDPGPGDWTGDGGAWF